jgi:hypothetical protein
MIVSCDEKEVERMMLRSQSASPICRKKKGENSVRSLCEGTAIFNYPHILISLSLVSYARLPVGPVCPAASKNDPLF